MPGRRPRSRGQLRRTTRTGRRRAAGGKAAWGPRGAEVWIRPPSLARCLILADHGLRDKVRVMVGGAPLNEAFAREYGADIYCRDARGAVEAAKRIMQTRQGERL